MVARRASAPRRSAPSQPSSSADSGRITVPKLNRDPVQSLRPWPVVVEAGGRDFEIPAMPAADWLALLMVSDLDLYDVFPGLLSTDDEAALLDCDLGLDEVANLALSVVETVSARWWWVTLRLVEVARSSWDVLGAELALKQVDADRVSLSSWLDVLLVTILRNSDPKDVQMFTLRLEAPPAQVTGRDEVEEEASMDRNAFLAMAR